MILFLESMEKEIGQRPGTRNVHGIDCKNYKQKFDNDAFRLISDNVRRFIFDHRDIGKPHIQQVKLD